MRTLSNRDVALTRSRLFAWGQGIEVPTPFANRVGALEQLSNIMRQATRSDQLKVFCVSDLLGSGKSFLIKHVLNTLEAAQVSTPTMGEDLAEKIAQPNPSPYDHLRIIDEWDIKSGVQFWLHSLNIIAERARMYGGTIMLVGDATLKCPYVHDYLGKVAPVAYIDLEPLTREFFELALQARLRDCFQDEGAEAFIDPALVNVLVPPWTRTVATFRGVFRTLDELSDRIEPSDDRCFIGREYVSAWLRERRSFAKRQVIECAEKLIAYVRIHFDHMEPLSENELMSLLGFKDENPVEFHKKIVVPLVAMECITPLGTPYIEPSHEYQKYVGPYLPAVRANLRVYFGE